MTFLPPEAWYAQLPTVYAAAAAIITNHSGELLLVKPNYRDHWLLTGGFAEEAEPPEEACAREIKEELGLVLTVGPLLVVGWTPPLDTRPKPIMNFLFDGGTLTEPTGISLQEKELDDHRFFPLADAITRVAPHIAAMLPAALDARAMGITAYRPSVEVIEDRQPRRP